MSTAQQTKTLKEIEIEDEIRLLEKRKKDLLDQAEDVQFEIQELKTKMKILRELLGKDDSAGEDWLDEKIPSKDFSEEDSESWHEDWT